MSNATSILAYNDVKEILDKAMSTEKGVRLEFATRGKAVHWRQRFYTFRNLDRAENLKLYPPGEHMHGKSFYDSYRATLEDERFIHVEPVSADSIPVTAL